MPAASTPGQVSGVRGGSTKPKKFPVKFLNTSWLRNMLENPRHFMHQKWEWIYDLCILLVLLKKIAERPWNGIQLKIVTRNVFASYPTSCGIFSQNTTACKPISDENAATITGVPRLRTEGAEDAASLQRSLSSLALQPVTFWEKIPQLGCGSWRNIACQNLIHYVILWKYGVRLQKIPIFPEISRKSQSDWNFRKYSNHCNAARSPFGMLRE